jgi:hypothetical protein
MLPFSHCSRIALRVAASSLGAFGVTETIALYAHNAAWGNVWERLCMRDGLGWGTSSEKALSAAFCFIFVGGLASDWYLHRHIGENPDEVSHSAVPSFYITQLYPGRNGIAILQSILQNCPMTPTVQAPFPLWYHSGTDS